MKSGIIPSKAQNNTLMSLAELRVKIAGILTVDSSSRLRSRESQTVEFKESFSWNNKATYARTLAAMANNKGGFIIFGVKDNPRAIVGLQNDAFERFDPMHLSDYLKHSFSSVLGFEVDSLEVNGLKVGWIYIYPAVTRPIVCVRSSDDGRTLKDGDIYYRNGACTERATSAEVLRLIEEQKELERKKWLGLIERASQMGIHNAAIMNLASGEISGPGGSLLIDESLLPQISFIREGDFTQASGAPALKLVGEVRAVPVVGVDMYANWIFPKRLGVELGFPEAKARYNACALIHHYGLNSPQYLHEVPNASGQPQRHYSPEVLAILVAKKEAGDFSPGDSDSVFLKQIRKEYHRTVVSADQSQ